MNKDVLQPLPAETAQPMFASHVGRRKWEQLQCDGYRMQRIHFARSVDGHERRGTIDPWGKVLWESGAAPPALQHQEVPREPVADFDTWQQHPYTKVLMNSIRDEYMPRADAEALIRAAASPSTTQGEPK